MTSMNLKPAPGRTVRDPATKKLLSAEGELKELDTFWRRRIAVGDAVEVTAGTPSGSSEQTPDAESEKTNSRRARRAAQAEE